MARRRNANRAAALDPDDLRFALGKLTKDRGLARKAVFSKVPGVRGPIITEHLVGLLGLGRAPSQALLAAQPRTVLEALRIHGVGRKTTRRLLDLGLLGDPEGVQHRSRTDEEMGLVDAG